MLDNAIKIVKIKILTKFPLVLASICPVAIESGAVMSIAEDALQFPDVAYALKKEWIQVFGDARYIHPQDITAFQGINSIEGIDFIPFDEKQELQFDPFEEYQKQLEEEGISQSEILENPIDLTKWMNKKGLPLKPTDIAKKNKKQISKSKKEKLDKDYDYLDLD